MDKANSKQKVVVATRTKAEDFDDCIKKLNEIDCECIEKLFIVCDLRKKNVKTEKEKKEIKVIFDPNPTRACSLNLVLDQINKNKPKNSSHLFSFSKEIEVTKKHIKNLNKLLNNSLIVVGYELRDNILSDEEYDSFSGTDREQKGIAYMVPWNTCAMWNKSILGKLRFDKICEKENNSLGKLMVKINGHDQPTYYQGMEDGLAIAELMEKNPKSKYKLIKDGRDPLGWNIVGSEEKKLKHKKKMARKNIVLSTFMNIRGYPVERLRKP